MTASGLRVHPGAYLDSLLLMSATVTMEQSAGVEWAGAAMATPRGLEELAGGGFVGGELGSTTANDVVLAVRARDDEAVQAALDAGWRAAFAERERQPTGTAEGNPASIAEAVRLHRDLNVAVVSVPGEYAALEAHHALTSGLHVLLFSDGVTLEEEIELKERAAGLGLLVMGPGAGTAVLAGIGLGFANVLGSTSGGAAPQVGVVAAAGTGAQEVSALLDRWGAEVTSVIGVGGRDLSEQVGGLMAGLAVRTLVNGRLVHRRSLDDLVRPILKLITDVTEFMSLHAGDVLLVGYPLNVPTAGAGDAIAVECDELGRLDCRLTAAEFPRTVRGAA